MWAILTNPITISVIVMCVICLLKVNVIISLFVASMIAGLASGLDPNGVVNLMIAGLPRNGQAALGYVLLGAFAAALAYTGLADMLARRLASMMKQRKILFLITMALVACISGTLIPVHISYIPILLPPLILMMNEMRLDRRAVACAMVFGLKAPYQTIPFSYGLIFHTIIATNMTANGMEVHPFDIFRFNWVVGIGMLVGLVSSIWYYRKARDYDNKEIDIPKPPLGELKFGRRQVVALVAIVLTLGGQIFFGSIIIGGLIGVLTFIIGGGIKLGEIDGIMSSGLKLMGLISFVMLIAGGYAEIVRESGALGDLIESTLAILGDSRLVFVIALQLVGLLITMGIGTSFGTVPILAVLYVPLSMEMGLSVGATIVLIASCAATGDAGAPGSDSTLGPTAGLNADGQHSHIWDTCVPSFIFYNIPIMIFGTIGAMMF